MTHIIYLFSDGRSAVTLDSVLDLAAVQQTDLYMKFYHEAVLIMTTDGQVLKNRYGPTGDIL